MKLAILGYGRIGGTLGRKWAAAGHTVTFGAREPNKPELQRLVQGLGENATAVSISQAIGSADTVVFAIPGSAMDETIFANVKALGNKIVVDTTNPRIYSIAARAMKRSRLWKG